MTNREAIIKTVENLAQYDAVTGGTVGMEIVSKIDLIDKDITVSEMLTLRELYTNTYYECKENIK